MLLFQNEPFGLFSLGFLVRTLIHVSRTLVLVFSSSSKCLYELWLAIEPFCEFFFRVHLWSIGVYVLSLFGSLVWLIGLAIGEE